jgi:hypothetical protein
MLMDDEADFLRQNLRNNSPMYRCYFVPRRQDMLRLRQRLCSLSEIARALREKRTQAGKAAAPASDPSRT